MRIAMVLTRATDDDVGRVKSMRAIHLALSGAFEVEVLRLRSFLETRRVADLVWAIGIWLYSVLCLRPMALQCVLFVTLGNARSILDRIATGRFDAVYIDMVRSEYLLKKLRAALPEIRIVTDLDDLISRRMKLWAEAGLPLSSGFIGPFLPTPLRNAFEKLLPSRLVQRYEFLGLARAEHELAEVSDAVVLVSPTESELLRSSVAAPVSSRIHAITPPADIRVEIGHLVPVNRFVFVGSDGYQPNRIAINVLLCLWQSLKPPLELYIYGRQKRSPTVVAGVHWVGFIEDIALAYAPGSVALAPLSVRGGIKTKVVEAWSFGCPVLGTPEALEGLCADQYPLSFPVGEWDEYLVSPHLKQTQWDAAARFGQNLVRRRLSVSAFQQAWRAQFFPASQVVNQ